jgi:hypothetical protein
MHLGKFNTILGEIEKFRQGEGFEISVQTQNRTYAGAHRVIEGPAGAVLVIGTNDELAFVDLDAVVTVQLAG